MVILLPASTAIVLLDVRQHASRRTTNESDSKNGVDELIFTFSLYDKD